VESGKTGPNLAFELLQDAAEETDPALGRGTGTGLRESR